MLDPLKPVSGVSELTMDTGSSNNLGKKESTIAPTALPSSPMPTVQAMLARLIHDSKVPYIVNPSYLQGIPLDDLTLTEATTVATKIYGSSADPYAQGACAIACWYKNNFGLNGSVTKTLGEIQGRSPTVGDYLDAVKKSFDELEDPIKFNFERFGPRQNNLSEAVKSVVLQAICEEVTIPNGVAVDSKNKLALIDYSRSSVEVSPAGREVPVLHVVPLQQNTFIEMTAKQDYVLVPESYLSKLNRDDAEFALKWLRNYQTGKYPGTHFDFKEKPQYIVHWLSIHYARIAHDTSGKNVESTKQTLFDQLIKESLLESLAESDSLQFAGAKMKRRVNELEDSDWIEAATHLVKDTSYLRTKLDSKADGKEKARFAKALFALRAGFTAFEKCPHSKLMFLESSLIGAFIDSKKIAEAGISKDCYELEAVEEFARLLGPKLYPNTLTMNEGENLESKRLNWRTWAHLNLKSSTVFADKDAQTISRLEDKLKEVIPGINSEHFVAPSDSEEPDWKNVKVDWKVKVAA